MNDIQLNTPFILKNGITIKNRFIKSATSEQLGDRKRNPRPALAKAYERWANGGVGIAITGNIMIDRTALGEPKNVVLDEKSDLKNFRQWTKKGTQHGTHLWAQLNHPGKQSPVTLSRAPVAPSAIPLEMNMKGAFAKPKALTEHEIYGLIEKFARSARLAKEVGFTGVQIHAAHGYLISQFHSSKHNQRTDKWGGSIENRMRFVHEVYRAVRAEVGNKFPVAVKLNSGDFIHGGFTEDESMVVAKSLSDAGIDLIEISGGTYESQAMIDPSEAPMKASTKKREAYFLHYAESVRQKVDTPLAVTGGFRSARGMKGAIQSDATDFVGLARPMMLYPDLPTVAGQNEDSTFDIKRPTTGFRALDVAMMVDLAWWEEQIHLMGKGKEPNVNFSAWAAVINNFFRMGSAAFKPRRA
ncbi:NADH oxidase [Gammaproteobacteria bacterium 45_16_T64]|nr:NADH oxidase [Gammaproteobacteria bacterium 45_16_T64]